MPLVTTILAIGSAIGPILFGFAFWKMEQVFVSKTQFEDFKRERENSMQEINRRLIRIEDNIIALMQYKKP